MNEETVNRNRTETLTEALDEDCGGAGRATMLRDDTALQIIMMAGYITAEDRGDG